MESNSGSKRNTYLKPNLSYKGPRTHNQILQLISDHFGRNNRNAIIISPERIEKVVIAFFLHGTLGKLMEKHDTIYIKGLGTFRITPEGKEKKKARNKKLGIRKRKLTIAFKKFLKSKGKEIKPKRR